MRDIKFRAWHEGHPAGVDPQMIYDTHPGDCLRYKNEGQSIKAIMQYTGLKDKNGKEIYEGDIVGMVANGVHGPRVIEFLNGAFGVRAHTSSKELWWAEVWHMDVEVIGTIYENKELLEVVSND